MKKQIGLITLSLMLVTPAMAGGAGAPAPKASAACKSIGQIIESDKDFSTLSTAIDAANLKAALKGAGSFTVFAPNNTAFAKVSSDQLADLLNDSEALRGLLLYHVVGEKATVAQIKTVKGGTTMQGSDITISVKGGKLMVNDATVIKGDIVACNGIVHVIDTVLMPPADAVAETAPAEAPASTPAPAPTAAPSAPIVIPALPLSGGTSNTTVTAPATTTDTSTDTSTDATATTDTSTDTSTDATATTDTSTDTSTDATATTDTSTDTSTDATATTEVTASETDRTVYDFLVSDERFSTLRDLISDAGLNDTLTTGEYTVFAPTNDAFNALPDGVLAAIRSDPDTLKKLLTYHVVASKVTTEQISSGADITTVEGSTLNLGTATVNTVVNATNGTIYPIDAILIPDDFKVPDVKVVVPDTSGMAPNIITLLTTDSRFSTLRSLLMTAGMDNSLTSGEYTIFAPTNDAFAKFDQTKLDSLKGDTAHLKVFLQHLLVEGRVASAELTNAPLKGLDGTAVTIAADGSNFKVGDASTDGKLINTGTGNVYVLDGVLLPDSLR